MSNEQEVLSICVPAPSARQRLHQVGQQAVNESWTSSSGADGKWHVYREQAESCEKLNTSWPTKNLCQHATKPRAHRFSKNLPTCIHHARGLFSPVSAQKHNGMVDLVTSTRSSDAQAAVSAAGTIPSLPDQPLVIDGQ